jgi:hypothetical protein
MKRNVSISLIALATVMMLVSGFVPHHHHEGVACVITEHCEKDDTTDEKHTNHLADNGMHHGQSCVVESDYISNIDRRIKSKVSSCDDCDNPDHIHVFPILCLVADFRSYLPGNVTLNPEYGEYIPSYTSADVRQSHGLRAPPFILS